MALEEVVLFHIGSTEVTAQKFAIVLSSIIGLHFGLKVIIAVVLKNLGKRGRDVQSLKSVLTFAHYFLTAVFLIIIFQTLGIDLTALTLLTSALGLGIGFGLQSIANNLISGVVLLVERPVKIGDRIQIGDVHGIVRNISLRATTVLTNDNISVIVPNSELVSGSVTNWTHNDATVRLSLSVGVSYHSNPSLVRETLLQCAKSHNGVLDEPAPDVLFEEFGDNALKFRMRFWTSAYSRRPSALISELNFMVFTAFANSKIEVPFPQLDLHIKSDSTRESHA